MPGYLTILRRHVVLVLVVMGLSVTTASLVSLQQPERWQARATVQLQQVDSPFRSSGGTKGDLTRAIQTQVDIAQSDAVRAAVQSRLGSVPPVTIGPKNQSDELEFFAEAGSAKAAADAANAWADSYRDTLRAQVQQQNAQAQAAYNTQYDTIQGEIVSIDATLPSTKGQEAASLRVRHDVLVAQLKATASRQDAGGAGAAAQQLFATPLKKALPPSAPASPRPTRAALLGLLVGLVGGYVLACVVEAVHDRVRSALDVRLVGTTAPVLGPVPVPVGRANALTLLRDPAAAMPYQRLRAELSALVDRTSPAVVAVTGPRGDEGASAVASGLAVMLTQAGRRVALVDADLGAPNVHRLLGRAATPGLADVLEGGLDLEEACGVHVLPRGERLTVLTGGSTQEADLLAVPNLSRLVGTLLEQVEIVVLDAPPMLTSANAVVVAGVATTVVVVAGTGRTTRRDLKAALARLELVDPVTCAVVLTEGIGEPDAPAVRAGNTGLSAGRVDGTTAVGADHLKPRLQ